MFFYDNIRIVFVVSALLFLGGCGATQPTLIPSEKPISTPTSSAASQEYHFAAPWDIQLFERFYADGAVIQLEGLPKIKGGIVPHHLISGHTVAAFYETAQNSNPSTIVLIGPNHFDRGAAPIQSTLRDWKTPFGSLKTNTKIITSLYKKGILDIEEDTVKEEHSIYSHMPFIRKSFGAEVSVVPILVKEFEDKQYLDELISALGKELPSDALIVASIDFSHYQPLPVAEFHDERSMQIVRNSDFARLSSIEIDSTASLYVFLRLMEQYGTQRVVHEHHTNSAHLAGVPDDYNSTSHFVPYFAVGKPANSAIVSILQFGDLMLDRGVATAIDTYGGLSHILDPLAGEEGRFFRGIDIITANLEGPFANTRKETTKEIAFRFDPRLIPELKKYGFNMFTLANNHSLDMGGAGFNETKQHLDTAGIAYYGNQFRVQESSLTIQEVGGMRIAWIGLNDTHNSMDESLVQELIEKAEVEADVTIINIHWGIEYSELSHPRQQALAHQFIDQGADIIIGHHPHVVQEIEIYKDAPIFYSLGNFVFDQYFSTQTQQGIAVGITLYDNKISLYVFPIQGNKSQVSYMPYKQAQLFMQDVFDRSKLDTYTFINNFHLELPL